MQGFDVFFDLHLNKQLRNTQDAGDLRCHHTHFVIIVTEISALHAY